VRKGEKKVDGGGVQGLSIKRCILNVRGIVCMDRGMGGEEGGEGGGVRRPAATGNSTSFMKKGGGGRKERGAKREGTEERE